MLAHRMHVCLPHVHGYLALWLDQYNHVASLLSGSTCKPLLYTAPLNALAPRARPSPTPAPTAPSPFPGDHRVPSSTPAPATAHRAQRRCTPRTASLLASPACSRSPGFCACSANRATRHPARLRPRSPAPGHAPAPFTSPTPLPGLTSHRLWLAPVVYT